MVPQISGMYQGDRKRKENLVKFGFRLKAALDNRPLNFEEFQSIIGQCIYISATPGKFELTRTGGDVVEQVIRPTGLLDPQIAIAPATGQIDHLIKEIAQSLEDKGRVIVTTLTKKTAEHLSHYLSELGYRAKYLHCDINAIERSDLIRDFRLGLYDILIGINLLREGLDIPEVNLVAILDADKEGFLRSERSLMQTVGRAARNEKGRAILYGDRITKSMLACLNETKRRRLKQVAYNQKKGFQPRSVIKPIPDTLRKIYKLSSDQRPDLITQIQKEFGKEVLKDPSLAETTLINLKERLSHAIENLNFEEASLVRDQVTILNNFILEKTLLST
jgi:excinuclease ABC subunit B